MIQPVILLCLPSHPKGDRREGKANHSLPAAQDG
jgi:hypothetical protein